MRTKFLILPFLSIIILITCSTLMDFESPKIRIISPSSGSQAFGFVHIQVETTDNKKIDHVELILDGSKVMSTRSGSLAYDWDLSKTNQNASHTIVVKAFDLGGNWSEVTVEFYGYGKPPSAPVLSSPVNANASNNGQPLLKWIPVPNAQAYHLQVGDFQFAHLAVDDSTLIGPQYLASLPDAVYLWRVRSRYNEGNWSEWSSVWTFRIDTQGPAIPQLNAPSDGGSTNENKPSFDWSDVTDAASYDFQADNSSGFEDSEVSQTGLTNSEYTAMSSLPDGVYYWRVRGRDMVGNYSDWSETRSFSIITVGSVEDADGNIYPTKKIDSQWWMTENLKVTHYQNGDPILEVTGNTEWENYGNSAYCIYDNNQENVDTYGLLYTWYAAADSRQIAPTGWHVPTDEEWQALIDYLGGNTIAGGKMKETGTTHWQGPNTGANNECGFSALPGGYRLGNGVFLDLGIKTEFWSSTVKNDHYGYSRGLQSEYTGVSWGDNSDKRHGYSIRCVKD